MPVIYEYDPNLNIVHSRPHGKLSTLGIHSHFKELIIDDKVKTEFVNVVHLENVGDFLFLSSEATAIILRLVNCST